MRSMNPDMEDIFKKAADEYPLKTSTADWGSVNKKLQSFGQNPIKRKIISSGSKVKAGLACAFLLIPLSLTITKFHYGDYTTEYAIATSKERKQVFDKNNEQVANKLIKDFKNNTQTNLISAVSNQEIIGKQKIVAPFELASLANREIEVADINKIIPGTACINGTIKNTVKQNNKSQPVFSNQDEAISNNSEEKKLAAENITKEKNVPNTSIKKPNTKKITHFYLGMAGAAELTSVKFQPTRRSVNGGGVIGYSINDKLNIELGMVLSKKYFYSNGKYIEPNSIRRDNAEILNAYAKSSITELPLTIQYNIKKDKASRIFAGAGIVSYVIHKEHYRYTYIKNGIEKERSRDFKKASNDLFSNVQLSAGYEHSILNNAGNIRIEPYFRIPVSGIGASNLPVTSVGINIALTKYIK